MTTPQLLRLAFVVACLLIVAYHARCHILAALDRSPRLCLALAGICSLAVFAMDTPK